MVFTRISEASKGRQNSKMSENYLVTNVCKECVGKLGFAVQERILERPINPEVVFD